MINQVSPNTGSPAGGYNVVITGAGFTGVNECFFGDVTAPFTINSDTQITATAPPDTAFETVDITLVVEGQQTAPISADQFTYKTVIASVAPAAGSPAGGYNVVITGTGFTGVNECFFGDVTAPFTINSDTQITATAPPDTTFETVDITLVVEGQQTAPISADQFTYKTVIASVAPAAGSLAGGYDVAITGTGFTGVKECFFGDVTAPFTINSDTQITATAPRDTTFETVDITLVVEGQQTPPIPADQFTYR